MDFEKKRRVFPATDEIPGVTAIVDYDVVLDDGCEHLVEAKSSRKHLKPSEREHLDLLKAHAKSEGLELEVVYGDELKRNGFIDTLMMLRRFGLMSYEQAKRERAHARLFDGTARTLTDWRKRAKLCGVPTSMLYHLLYNQQLELVFEPLLPSPLNPCRD